MSINPNDHDFDWDEAADAARAQYEVELRGATRQGQPLPETEIESALEGWDRCGNWIKAMTLRRHLRG